MLLGGHHLSSAVKAGFSCGTSYEPLELLTFAWLQICQLPGLTTRRLSTWAPLALLRNCDMHSGEYKITSFKSSINHKTSNHWQSFCCSGGFQTQTTNVFALVAISFNSVKYLAKAVDCCISCPASVNKQNINQVKRIALCRMFCLLGYLSSCMNLLKTFPDVLGNIKLTVLSHWWNTEVFLEIFAVLLAVIFVVAYMRELYW